MAALDDVKAPKHLWEYDHPYYASTNNYRAMPGECLEEYETWAEFIAEHRDDDPEQNLVFRWDWERVDEEAAAKYFPDEESPGDLLWLFVVHPRRGDYWAICVGVTEKDEPAVLEWLTERARHIAALWEPIPLTTVRG